MIKKIVLDKADRLYQFPFDLDEFVPKRSFKAGEKKIATIDLARFNWDVGFKEDSGFEASTAIAAGEEIDRLKELAASWLEKEFGVKADPDKEIYIGQGIHRIIYDMVIAYIEPGDIVLCPEPGLPFYKRLTIAGGGTPITYPVFIRSDYKPSLAKVDSRLGKAAKIMIVNNPGNPVGALFDETDLSEIIHLASKQNIFIVNDAAYGSLAEDKFRPLWSLPGGRKVSLEIFSFSLTLGLPYLPFGFAVGPREIINAIKIAGHTIKTVIPSVWIKAAEKVIEGYPSAEFTAFRKKINQSRLAAGQLINKTDWELIGGKSCPFLWLKIPERQPSAGYAASLLRRKRILTLPGTAFGETCDGYLRLSLTASVADYEEAAKRISKKFALLSRPEEEAEEE